MVRVSFKINTSNFWTSVFLTAVFFTFTQRNHWFSDEEKIICQQFKLSVTAYHFCSAEWRPGPWFLLHNSLLCPQTYSSCNDFPMFKTAALKIERKRTEFCERSFKVLQPTAVFTWVKMFRLVPVEVPLRKTLNRPPAAESLLPAALGTV